jgi:hypothetical protein
LQGKKKIKLAKELNKINNINSAGKRKISKSLNRKSAELRCV